jgi:hypothetical protein
MTSRRLVTALAVLPLLAACSVTLDLYIARSVRIQAPAGAFEKVQVVDVMSDPTVADHAGKVDHVSIDEVRVTVTALGAGHRASSVDLWLRVRPEGAPADGSGDLVLGAIQDLPFVVGATATVPGSNALDELLLSAVKGGGTPTVLASGSLDGAAEADLEVAFSGTLVYGLF